MSVATNPVVEMDRADSLQRVQSATTITPAGLPLPRPRATGRKLPGFPDLCPLSKSLLTFVVPDSQPILVSSLDRQIVLGTSRVPSSKSSRFPTPAPLVHCVPVS